MWFCSVCKCGFDFRLKPLFASMNISKFKGERAHFRNSGMKGLMKGQIAYLKDPALNNYYMYPYLKNPALNNYHIYLVKTVICLCILIVQPGTFAR